MSSIQDRLRRQSTAWRPDPGDEIVGVVVEIDERETEFGVYPLVVVETDDHDEIAIHGFHTVLKNELARRQPREGDTLGIRYVGKNVDRGYEVYRVVIDRAVPHPDDGPDWAAMASESAADLGDVPPTPSDDDAPPPDTTPY